MAKPVYVVTMYRWANREAHSYVLGVYTNASKAEKAAASQKLDRGNKYYPEILEYLPNRPSSRKIILPLDV